MSGSQILTGRVSQGPAGRQVAMVFGDPSIDGSDVKIFDGAHIEELDITGNGFNFMARPVLDFDPPLDLATVTIDVSGTVQNNRVIPTPESPYHPVGGA